MDNLLNRLFKKKSEAAFRKELMQGVLALVFYLAGLAFIYLRAKPWYPKGILLGLAGLDLLYLFTFVRALLHKTYFKQLYIQNYDERNKEILKLSALASSALVFGMIIYHFGYAFGAELVSVEPKMISLSGFCGTLLGTGLIGFFGTNFILQKYY